MAYSQSVNAVSDSVIKTVNEMGDVLKIAKDEASIIEVGKKSMVLAKKLSALAEELKTYPLPTEGKRKELEKKHHVFSQKKGHEVAETLAMLMSKGHLMPLFSKEMGKIQSELNKSKPVFDKYFKVQVIEDSP